MFRYGGIAEANELQALLPKVLYQLKLYREETISIRIKHSH